MTPKQMKAFWPVFAAACREQGLTTQAKKEEYRHKVLLQEANAGHLADVSDCYGYDRVMARLHSDAGSYESAVKYTTASIDRLIAMVEDCARQVLELSGTAATCDRSSYIAGILVQSKMDPNAIDAPKPLLDYPEPSLKRLFMVLDARRRALQLRWMAANCRRVPVGFKFGRTWL